MWHQLNLRVTTMQNSADALNLIVGKNKMILFSLKAVVNIALKTKQRVRPTVSVLNKEYDLLNRRSRLGTFIERRFRTIDIVLLVSKRYKKVLFSFTSNIYCLETTHKQDTVEFSPNVAEIQSFLQQVSHIRYDTLIHAFLCVLAKQITPSPKRISKLPNEANNVDMAWIDTPHPYIMEYIGVHDVEVDWEDMDLYLFHATIVVTIVTL